MIISAKVIQNPRTNRHCEGYRHEGFLMGGGEPRIRVYGSAYYGDPPYVIYLCMRCARESKEQKIKDALSAYDNKSSKP